MPFLGQGSNGKSIYKRPIKFNTVDKHMFLDKLSQFEMPEDYQDHESAIQQVSNTWYLCADASKSAFASPEQSRDPLLSRWENLIKNKEIGEASSQLTSLIIWSLLQPTISSRSF